jgi:hypothetical protein
MVQQQCSTLQMQALLQLQDLDHSLHLQSSALLLQLLLLLLHAFSAAACQ